MKKYLLVICLMISNFLWSQQREFRGAWVATVANIDWPSQSNLTSEQQKEEFINILETLNNYNFNAVIVQIRPLSDAFYDSSFEPWSKYLTGKSGVAPLPYYDPLKWMINETHKRGMEFHAWINPFRAYSSPSNPHVYGHVTHTHPNWFYKYGGTTFFNAGVPESRAYLYTIVKDIVSRYDIDALHMDDYFYPYRIKGKEIPDESEYIKYNPKYLSREDWRRENINNTIENLSKIIYSIKPYCRFGVSPFGVWRNQSKDPMGSNTNAGQTNYDDLYADILLWMKKGWVDYVAPQLYWERGHKAADFYTLIDWWKKNSYNTNLYVGLQIYKLKKPGTGIWANTIETEEEVKLSRQYNYEGQIFYSTNALMSNSKGIGDVLKYNLYKEKLLCPKNEKFKNTCVSEPEYTKYINNGFANIKFVNSNEKYMYVLYSNSIKNIKTAKIIKVSNEDILSIPINSGNYYWVSYINKANIESNKTEISL